MFLKFISSKNKIEIITTTIIEWTKFFELPEDGPMGPNAGG